MPARIVSAALIMLIVLYAAGVSAATYVSDELSVNMRRGAGYNFGISELVKAGTQVAVLSRGGGWTKIRTPKGETGFVLSRFLTNTPAARDRLQGMQARVEQLEQTNQDLKQELAKALGGAEELGKLKRELIAENKRLKSELTEIKRAASNAVKLRDENQHFRKKILAMESEIEGLRHENKALQSRRDGMKVGAFILVVGIVLGLLLPLFRRRKRNTWDSL